MVSFGRQLVEARDRAGLSQAKLAELSGVGKRTIQELEADKHAPQRKTRIALSQVLEIEGPGDKVELFEEFSEPVQTALLIAGAYLEGLDQVALLEWVGQFTRTNDQN